MRRALAVLVGALALTSTITTLPAYARPATAASAQHRANSGAAGGLPIIGGLLGGLSGGGGLL
ncbi:hypothetical protein ACIGXM_06045 [Kitasatospora sp. NPDC052896]|uniref:hypothetical protein n=1 Tax=Kitasatospora sp. NPDC052896 TaxID=3364061 RepID=UPI0037C58DBE